MSISLIINSGIINKAKYGVDKYSEEEELEQIKLAVASARLKGNGFLTTENLNSELQAVFNDNKTVIQKENTEYYTYKTSRNYRIYKDASVEMISKRYLYKEGNIFIDVTGGWEKGGEVYNHNGAIDNNTYFTVGVDNAQAGYGTEWHTVNKIDTTGYNYLCLKYDVMGNSDDNCFGCCSGFTQNYNWKDNPKSVFRINIPYIDNGENTIKIDLNSDKRQGKFYVFIYNRRTTNIYEVWLE